MKYIEPGVEPNSNQKKIENPRIDKFLPNYQGKLTRHCIQINRGQPTRNTRKQDGDNTKPDNQ